MKGKVLTSLIFVLNAVASFAQNFQQQTHVIKENKITLKKTTCLFYNDGLLADSFLSATTTFNSLGYSLQHTIFKKNGAVQGKFVSEYKADSLEIKETSFDSAGNTIVETFRQYDDGGQVKSMNVRFNIAGKEPIAHFFETDSTAHTRKDYGFSEDEKKLLALQQYDNNWRLIAATYFDREGKSTNRSLYEYDDLNNTRKDFSETDGIKKLRSERKYNADNLLVEEIHYYSNNVSLSGGNTPVQNFKKGDVRKILFSYDTHGLLQKQIETVNQGMTMKLQFEYLK